MTPSQLEHLKLIDAYCEHKLAAAKYIPHYSEGAEAGWKATRAAILSLLEMHKFLDSVSVGSPVTNAIEIVQSALLPHILNAFPLELVKP